MTDMAVAYVEQSAAGGWRVAGSRVSLDSIVEAYWAGEAPETIVANFPTLSLEQVHGAIAFYLRNRAEIDRHLAAQDARWEQLRAESEQRNQDLIRRLRGAREGKPGHAPQ